MTRQDKERVHQGKSKIAANTEKMRSKRLPWNRHVMKRVEMSYDEKVRYECAWWIRGEEDERKDGLTV